jgi:hypothetical protein
MRTKNRMLGALISAIIIVTISLTGIFENTLRGITIFIVLVIGLNILVPYILEIISKKQNG